MTTIQTERLQLRPFAPKDADGLLAYYRQPRTDCFIGERMESREDALRWMHPPDEGMTRLAVCLKETDEVIGDVFALKEGTDTYNVGWNDNRRYEGRSYAYEAATAFIDCLMHQRGGRRIYGYVEEDNRRSRRLCERLGMRDEALFREFISFRNDAKGRPVYVNTLVYAVLRHEWDRRIILKKNGVLECSDR